MKIFVSVAVSTDGYLDDNCDNRLVISSEEDWAEVYRLRAQYDAIMVGAETLRRDNPSLIIKGDQARKSRISRGLRADIIKVTATRRSNLNPEMRFFTVGGGQKIVFSSNRNQEHIDKLSTVIYGEQITARFIVDELEKRGVEGLFIEGGNEILKMFFEAGLVDIFRVAVNTNIIVGDSSAPKLDIGSQYKKELCIRESFGEMEIKTYIINSDYLDEEYLEMAINQGRKCIPTQTSYCVGAVILTADNQLFTGYTHETSPTHHAEQEAIKKALKAGAELKGATIYSSMEPCSDRSSEPDSCTSLIIKNRFSRVVFAYYEPSHFVECCGSKILKESGVEVKIISSLAQYVQETNRHICSK